MDGVIGVFPRRAIDQDELQRELDEFTEQPSWSDFWGSFVVLSVLVSLVIAAFIYNPWDALLGAFGGIMVGIVLGGR